MCGDVTNTGVSQTPGNVELVYNSEPSPCEVELAGHPRSWC